MPRKRSLRGERIFKESELKRKRFLNCGWEYVIPGYYPGDPPIKENLDWRDLCEYCYHGMENIPFTTAPDRRICLCDQMLARIEVNQIMQFYFAEAWGTFVFGYYGPKNG